MLSQATGPRCTACCVSEANGTESVVGHGLGSPASVQTGFLLITTGRKAPCDAGSEPLTKVDSVVAPAGNVLGLPRLPAEGLCAPGVGKTMTREGEAARRNSRRAEVSHTPGKAGRGPEPGWLLPSRCQHPQAVQDDRDPWRETPVDQRGRERYGKSGWKRNPRLDTYAWCSVF